MELTVGNYTLTRKYHYPCIVYKEDGKFVEDFTYATVEDAIADMLFFCWEDKLFHGTAEFKQSKQSSPANKYREILENKCPNIGFAKLNANVITGLK